MTTTMGSDEFWALMKAGSRSTSAHGVREIRAEFRHDLVHFGSHIIETGGLAIVRGSNVVCRDVTLVGEHQPALISLQLGLRGSASARHEGLSSAVLSDAGRADLFCSPGGKYAVALKQGTTNAAFRLNLAPAYFASLSERYPILRQGACAPLAAGKAAQLGSRNLGPLEPLLELVDQIMDSEHYGSLRPMFLESKVIELLARFLKIPALGSSAPLKPRDLDRMLDARQRLVAQLARTPTLAELAKSVGTNEFKLKQDFKAAFGQSVHAFALNRRLEHARSLLLDTDLPVSEIACQVGYAHVSHFGAAFRKRFGIAPSRLRGKRN